MTENIEIESKKEERKNPFETESIFKLIGKFAIPCVISLVVNALYNIVDQIFIGQGVGYLGNGATNVVFPITVICLGFSVLVGDGAAAYLSIKLGEKKKEEASKGVGNAIVLVSILAILFFFLTSFLKGPLLELFGVTDNVRSFAEEYMSIIIYGLPFAMITTAINSLIRADGSPKFAMITMLVGAIVNTILDPIMIFKFNMGVEGAAIATVIGQVLSFIITLCYLKKFKSVTLNKEMLKPEAKVIKKITSLGISSFITQIAITIVIIVMNNSLGYYGAHSSYGSDIPISALGIVMKVNQILISIIIGVSIGAQPIIGFNYGAKNYGRVKKTFLTAISIITVMTSIGFIIFEFFPQLLVNLFGQEEGRYNEFALKCFRIFLMLCICNGIQISSGIFFQAIGKPIKSFLLSMSRQIVLLIPAILILPRFFGINGILYAQPVADGIAFCLAVVLIIREMKKLTRLEKEEELVPLFHKEFTQKI